MNCNSPMRLYGCDDLRGFGMIFYAFNAFQTTGLGSITVGGGDDVTVCGFQTETVLPCFVLKQFKFGMGADGKAFFRPVFNAGRRRIFLNGGDALTAGSIRGINLGGGDDLTVSGFKIKFQTGCNTANDKFTHTHHRFQSRFHWFGFSISVSNAPVNEDKKYFENENNSY